MLKDLANVEQARSWDGDDGEHWTAHAPRYERAVRAHYERMRAAWGIGAGDRVLDVGCGCGESTIDAARAASGGLAHGIDLSSRMLAYARERAQAAGLTNVTFEQTDAQVHPFAAGAYDVAISRTGGMFFADPIEAYTNIGRALRRGGRLVLMTWQGIERNEWMREIQAALAAGRQMPPPPPDAPGPLSLSDPATVRRVLASAGFENVALEPFDGPFYAGTDTDDAYAFMSGTGIVHGMLADANDELRALALANLRATLAAHDTGSGVIYDSGSWIITATRP